MRPGLPYAALFLAAFGTALPQGRAETANVVMDKETWRTIKGIEEEKEPKLIVPEHWLDGPAKIQGQAKQGDD